MLDLLDAFLLGSVVNYIFVPYARLRVHSWRYRTARAVCGNDLGARQLMTALIHGHDLEVTLPFR